MGFRRLIPKPLRRHFDRLAGPSPRILRASRRLPVTGIAVTEYGRLGNNLIQLANALILAEVAGFRYVRLPKMPFLALSQPTESHGLCLLPRNAATRHYGHFVEDTFYRPPTSDTGVLSQAARRNALRRHVLHLMSLPTPVPAEDTDLVIHIRSGDIFSENPHPGFVQPPFAYYRNIIHARSEAGTISRVKLVFEDRKNPCVDAVCDYCTQTGLPLIEQSGTLDEDMAHLLGARNLVIGTGSFGAAVCFLSDKIRHVDSFDMLGGFYTGFGADPEVTHWQVCTDRYIAANGWRNTAEQRRLMLELPSTDIRVVAPVAPRPQDAR